MSSRCMGILKDDQNDLDVVASSSSVWLCTSVLLTIASLHAETVLGLPCCEILAWNGKIINNY